MDFPETLIGLVAVGVGAGLVSGLFGLGGGILSVPGILFLTGTSIRLAVAGSLVAMVLSAPVAAWAHQRQGRDVDAKLGALLGALGLVGVGIAIAVDRYTSERVLSIAFAAFLAYSAARLHTPAKPRVAGARGPLYVAGTFAGVLAKLLGVGGGLVLVPALIFSGAPVLAAIGTSLVAVTINAGLSTTINVYLLHSTSTQWISWGLTLGAGSLVGALVGVRLARRTPSAGLRRLLAIVLVLVGIAVVGRVA